MAHIDSIKEQLEFERDRNETLMRKLLGDEVHEDESEVEIPDRPIPGWNAQRQRLQGRMRKEYESSMKEN